MATLGNTPRPAYVYDTETDTWVPIGVGAHTHDYIPNTLVDAKGDILTATADNTPAKLSIGADGTVLVSDSSTATGLSWQQQFVAGKNKIINGDFRINQRAFTSTTTNGGYGFDRWRLSAGDGTTTYSAETFTPGTAPVSGYEGINFARIASTGQTSSTANSILAQRIEDVRTFAGQTVTISFWAKADSGTPKVALEMQQNFGSGGSPSSGVNTSFGQVTLSTSWARYTGTATVPSISEKTFGTNVNSSFVMLQLWTSAGSTYDNRTGSMGIQSATIDFWGVQVEAGSVATPFTTATGTIQGELAACQRYYFRMADSNSLNFRSGINGAFAGSTTAYLNMAFPVTMRVTPTSIEYANLTLYDYGADRAVTALTLLSNGGSPYGFCLTATVASGGTQYRPVQLTGANSASAYIGLSSEL